MPRKALYCSYYLGYYVHHAGLQAGQATASPKPIFARLEGDFVTTVPDVPQKVLTQVKS